MPHALRLWLGAGHRLLIPSSFFIGAAFLAICDTIARTALAPAEVPAGVIHSHAGRPFLHLAAAIEEKKPLAVGRYNSVGVPAIESKPNRGTLD